MRALAILAVAVLALVSPIAAWAQALAGASSFVEAGPIRLDASGAGRFSVKNTGSATLHVNTIYARTHERDPRLPGTLSVRFEGGATKADLAPGEARVVTLAWDRRGARLGQLVGHVVVESSDPGAPQRAIGVIGGGSGGLRDHLASALVALPLLGVLLILPLGASRRLDPKNARWIALTVTGVMAALVVFLARAFDPAVSRLDGNDGLQFVERARLLGEVEWHLGVDGIALPALVAWVTVAFFGVLASFRLERRHAPFFASQLTLVACVTGALLAQDAALFAAFFAAALLPTAFLVSRFGGERGRSVALRLVGGLALSAAALCVLAVALHRASDATFLVDGARGRSFAFAELARTDFIARGQGGATVLGQPLVKGVLALLLIAAATPLAWLGVHGAWTEVFSEVEAGAAALVAAGFGSVGGLVLLRFGVMASPGSIRWAAPGLAAFGAATVAWSALAALGARDLRRLVALVAVGHGGVVLLAVSAGTPQGLAGAAVSSPARAVVLAALLLVAGVLRQRVRSTPLEQLTGVAEDMPRLALLAAFGFASAAALPGTASFGAVWLAIAGAFPSHRLAAGLAAAGMLLLGVAVAKLYAGLFLGTTDDRLRRSPDLEPFGGHLPDVRRRETIVLVGLAAFVLLTGLLPRLLTGLTQGTV
jgi:NADH-quinone oxidoreductase subunit M